MFGKYMTSWITVPCAIILKEGKILLVKDNKGWVIPGGKVEEGETPLEALVREVKEETSLEIDPSSVWKVFDGFVEEGVRLPIYHVRRWKGEPEPAAKDVFEVKWFPLEETRAILEPFVWRAVRRSLRDS